MTVYSADIEGRRSYAGKMVLVCLFGVLALVGMIIIFESIYIVGPLLFTLFMLFSSLTARYNLFQITFSELELLERDTRDFPNIRKNVDDIISKQNFITNYQYKYFKDEVAVARELRVALLFKGNADLEKNT